MDWIKIKSEHISPLYSNTQIGALIRFQLFVAKYGRMPVDKEITKLINSNCLVSLKQVMSTLGVSLEYIASKVIEDREHVNSKNEAAKLRKRKQRDLEKVSHVTSNDSHKTDKIREEDIIVHKTKENENINKDSKEYIISEYLYQKILTINPNHKKPNFQSWSKDVDKMIRIDNRTEEQIKYIIDWLYSGTSQANFWRKNILSISKLRQKFDQLIAVIKTDKENKSQGVMQNGLRELAKEWGL